MGIFFFFFFLSAYVLRYLRGLDGERDLLTGYEANWAFYFGENGIGHTLGTKTIIVLSFIYLFS
jgi:hypothetical protein